MYDSRMRKRLTYALGYYAHPRTILRMVVEWLMRSDDKEDQALGMGLHAFILGYVDQETKARREAREAEAIHRVMGKIKCGAQNTNS